MSKSERETLYKQERGVSGAVLALSAGKSFGLVSGDHLSGETCAQAITRLADVSKARLTDGRLAGVAATAVQRLLAGKGLKLAAGDHSSDTCVETIVRLT